MYPKNSGQPSNSSLKYLSGFLGKCTGQSFSDIYLLNFFSDPKPNAHSLNLGFGSEKKFRRYISENDWPVHFPRKPERYFKEEFEGWPEFLGYKGRKKWSLFSVSYEEVKAYAHSLNLGFGSEKKFRRYISENDWPVHFPRKPERYFKEEFEGWPEFLGYKGRKKWSLFSVSYEEVKAYAHSLNLGFGSEKKFRRYISENDWPVHFPRKPERYFKEEFEGWPEFLGY